MTNQELFNQKMTALADAINGKAETTGKMTIDEMIQKVNNLNVFNYFPVGGKIFYIDNSSSGATYTFLDGELNVITPTVGSSPVWVKVEGTPNKDKYYIFNATMISSKWWTYKNSSDKFVYERTYATDTALGTGRINTQKVLALHDGAYIQSGNVWYELNQMNTNLAGGHNDWYIPSNEEMTKLWNSNQITKSGHTYGMSNEVPGVEMNYQGIYLSGSSGTYTGRRKEFTADFYAIRSI